MTDCIRFRQIELIGYTSTLPTPQETLEWRSLPKLSKVVVHRVELSSEHATALANLTQLVELELVDVEIDADSMRVMKKGLRETKIINTKSRRRMSIAPPEN